MVLFFARYRVCGFPSAGECSLLMSENSTADDNTQDHSENTVDSLAAFLIPIALFVSSRFPLVRLACCGLWYTQS